jgi:hypothetical protein
LAHGIIDVISDNALAYRYGVFDTVALTDVLGHEALLARVVSNRHPAPAEATDHQALQQRWALARGTLSAVGSDGMCVFLKTPEILLVLLPRDVAGMSILQ